MHGLGYQQPIEYAGFLCEVIIINEINFTGMNEEMTATKESESRRQFLRTAGSTALFATLGIGFYGCGSDTVTADISGDDAAPGARFSTVNANTEGVTISSGSVVLDLSTDALQFLNTQGSAILITGANVLAVNVGGQNIRAFTSVCTHQGCSIQWTFGEGQFTCTCHGSRFDTGGAVTRGPATRNLAEYSVSRGENIVTITIG
ncbi:MAG: Rieske (2Fe-2S) protein [Balneolaceae bacterium]|nr:MAG: Rieske (2Fe-2S) protein [Balneolaceae bacterium]